MNCIGHKMAMHLMGGSFFNLMAEKFAICLQSRNGMPCNFNFAQGHIEWLKHCIPLFLLPCYLGSNAMNLSV